MRRITTRIGDAVKEEFTTVESKVKYPNLRKQPMITVDYVKNEVKSDKAIEVKGIYSDVTATSDGAKKGRQLDPLLQQKTKSDL